MAAATTNVDDNTTISCPTPNPGGGSGISPTFPPIAFARPPLVVNQGSHALTRTTSAQSTTNHAGRRRAMR